MHCIALPTAIQHHLLDSGFGDNVSITLSPSAIITLASLSLIISCSTIIWLGNVSVG
jgi:hypothetical protein